MNKACGPVANPAVHVAFFGSLRLNTASPLAGLEPATPGPPIPVFYPLNRLHSAACLLSTPPHGMIIA